MRVLITGATGNVGTSLIEALTHEPGVEEIVGVARRLPSWSPPKTTWVQSDVVEDDLAPHVGGTDVVVHLAWLFQPTHDPLVTWRNNVRGSINVFRAVAETDVPSLIYASSVGAYSPGPKERPVDESWPTEGLPTAAYSREKAYVERVLDSFERERPQTRVVRLRPGFIFKPESASQQRRLFAGPLVPGRLVRSALIPVIPDLPGLRFQTLHSADAADAYRMAVVGTARGAFNIAADPVIDAHNLADLFGAKTVSVPRPLVRAMLAAAWHLHLVPASPNLLDLALSVPIMDTTRAQRELGVSFRHSSLDALRAFLDGLNRKAGMDTPPLAPKAGGILRWREVGTGVGTRPGS